MRYFRRAKGDDEHFNTRFSIDVLIEYVEATIPLQNRLPLMNTRSCFLVIAFFSISILSYGQERPNIVLMMADDLGYGDTGFNGNEIIQTPHLDQMAKDGAVFRHFYAGGPVCSPTRGTCLTGRHHFRYGVFSANVGHLPKQEITLAQMLKSKGYATGHFGKWHLGTLDRVVSSKGKKRKPDQNYAPPWERDYDRSFVTESAVSTWDPGLGKRAVNNPFYDDGVAVDPKDESLLGGASRVVVDRAVPFMEESVKNEKPFLAVVWFHAPHEDIKAGPEYLKKYEGYGEAAHYYGCITELDEQVGRIRKTLDELGVADNTLIFFCSDNGPEGKKPAGRRAGMTDGLRGRKRSLFDGGVRVPALAVWPGRIEAASMIDTPCSTLDYFPTIAELVDFEVPASRIIDGENIFPVMTGEKLTRSKSIPFRHAAGASLVKDGFKLILPVGELYELTSDRSEANDVSQQHPEQVSAMRTELESYLSQFKSSHAGQDYEGNLFSPVDPWRELKTKPKRE